MYTMEQVRITCEQLSDPVIKSYNQISKSSGLNKKTIDLIYRRKIWKFISKDYKFPYRTLETKYSLNDAKNVCKILDEKSASGENISFKRIARITSTSKEFVKLIYIGDIYPDESEKHIFRRIIRR